MRATTPLTDTATPVHVPEDLPFLESLSWFDARWRELSAFEMLQRYERGFRHRGVTADLSTEEAAFLRLLVLRKHGWPNTRMVEFADQLLKRDGALMRGLLAYRKALIAAKPQLSDVIRNIGRGHELPA